MNDKSGGHRQSGHNRELNDYYATEPKAAEWLCELINLRNCNVWECACGEGHLSKVLEEYGNTVKSTDLVDRGYGIGGIDFLKSTEKFDGHIVTNPPFKLSAKFVLKALSLVPDGNYVCMFLKLQFLESTVRRSLFDTYPPKYVYVSSSRLCCAKNAQWEIGSSTVAYAWYVWEKGFDGDPVIRWFN